MSLFLVVVEAARTLFVSFLFDTGLTIAPAIVGLVALFVYSHDRVYYDTEDIYNSPRRVAFVEEYRQLLVVSLVVVFVCVEYLAAIRLDIFEFVVFQAPFLVVGVYDYLKRFLLLDTLAVALSQALVIIVVPIAIADVHVETASALAAFTFVFLRGVCAVQLNNIDDRDGDIRANKNTLVSMLSLRAVKLLVAALYLCSLVVLSLLISLSVPVVLSYLVTFLLVTCLTAETANRNYILNSFSIVLLLGHFLV